MNVVVMKIYIDKFLNKFLQNGCMLFFMEIIFY